MKVSSIVLLGASFVTVSAQANAVLEEVVVTAQKRSENLQSVPFAVTALDGDDLQRLGVGKTDELAKSVPNLQINSPYGDTQPNFSLRGISVGNEYNANQASPIGVYFDEVYMSARFTHGVQLFDLERVEVLRGPQGTLYGRNTTGGAVNFISRKPQLEDNNATLNAGIGNFSALKLGGAGEWTINDKLGVRVALDFSERDGFIENTHEGVEDTQSEDSLAGRLSLRFRPDDTLDILLKIHSAQSSPTNVGAIQIGRLADGMTLPQARNPLTLYSRADDGLALDQVRQNRGGEFVTENQGVSLHIKHDAGDNWSWTAISNWDKGHFHQDVHDADGSPVRWVELDWRTDYEQFAQDLRIEYVADNWQTMLGAYYTQDTFEADNKYELYQGLATLAPAQQMALLQAGVVPLFVQQNFEQTRDSFALYSHSQIDITDQVSLTLGLRWTSDSSDYDKGSAYAVVDPNAEFAVGPLIDTTIPGGFFAAVVALPDGTFVDAFSGRPLPASEAAPGFHPNATLPRQSASESELTGTLKVSWQATEQQLYYFGFSRGYRAGAFNGGGYFSQHQIEYARPEFVDAWEFGMKSRFWQQRAQLNVSAFQYDYTDQQVQQVLGTVAFLRNAGESRIRGVEIESSLLLHENLRLDINAGFMDAKYSDLLLPAPNTGGSMNLSGNTLPSAPRRTLSLALEWTLMSISSGELQLRLNSSWRDRIWFSPFNAKDGNAGLQQPAYWQHDTQLSWQTDDYSVVLWGKNLADKEYFSYGLDLRSGFGYDYLARGMPRSFGVTLQRTF